MSLLGDLLKLLKFGREERRADAKHLREEKHEYRADSRDLRDLLEEYIENAEKALQLTNDQKTQDELRMRMLQYRAIKAQIIEAQISNHPRIGWDSGIGEGTGILPSRQLASMGVSIRIGSASADPGSIVTVPVVIEARGVTIGAYTIDVMYDDTLATPVRCRPMAGGVCNPTLTANTVRLVGVSASGWRDTFEVGEIAFRLGAQEGVCELKLGELLVADATYFDPQDITEFVQVAEGSITTLRK